MRGRSKVTTALRFVQIGLGVLKVGLRKSVRSLQRWAQKPSNLVQSVWLVQHLTHHGWGRMGVFRQGVSLELEFVQP